MRAQLLALGDATKVGAESHELILADFPVSHLKDEKDLAALLHALEEKSGERIPFPVGRIQTLEDLKHINQVGLHTIRRELARRRRLDLEEYIEDEAEQATRRTLAAYQGFLVNETWKDSGSSGLVRYHTVVARYAARDLLRRNKHRPQADLRSRAARDFARNGSDLDLVMLIASATCLGDMGWLSERVEQGLMIALAEELGGDPWWVRRVLGCIYGFPSKAALEQAVSRARPALMGLNDHYGLSVTERIRHAEEPLEVLEKHLHETSSSRYEPLVKKRRALRAVKELRWIRSHDWREIAKAGEPLLTQLADVLAKAIQNRLLDGILYGARLTHLADDHNNTEIALMRIQEFGARHQGFYHCCRG